MLKYVFILTLCFCLCAANDLSETGRKKGGYLLYGTGVLYYLTFLLIKVKIVAVVGTLIAIALVAGKIFAFYKYLAYAAPHHHIEPVYEEIPHHHDFHYEKEVYLDHPPYEAEHDQTTYTQQPPDNHDKTYSTYAETYSSPYTSNYHARKINNVNDIYDMTTRIFKSLKLSELAFDAMHIKSDNCKKRFMCEAFFHAENNTILSLGLSILNDTSQEKYRPEKEVLKLDDCQLMYDECEKLHETSHD